MLEGYPPDGGLATIKEKSLGAYAKSGQSAIDGVVIPEIEPTKQGLYLLDVVPDVEVRFGRILEGRATLSDVGREIYELVQRVDNGERTKSEALGYREFILTYKTFGPLGPACVPVHVAAPSTGCARCAQQRLVGSLTLANPGSRLTYLFPSVGTDNIGTPNPDVFH